MKFIFVGPKKYPITGQSISFHLTSDNFQGDMHVLCYGGKSKLGILCSTLWIALKLFFILTLFRGRACLYFTSSRSKFGFFLRDFLFIHIARLFDCRIVNHLHGADFIAFRNSLGDRARAILDFTYKSIDTSLVLLPSMKEQYSMYQNMKVEVLSNCAPDIGMVSQRYKHGQLRVLYLSNVMYSKGIFPLIEAVKKLHIKDVDVKLLIAGDIMGDDYMSANVTKTKFFEAINGYDFVEYLGVLTGKKKSDVLLDAHVFALPSFYKTEAQPLSIIEAMSVGLPIITTSHNYLSDMVTSKNGFVVPVNDSASIFDSLQDLINCPSLLDSISNNNLSEYKLKYSLSSYIVNINNILKNKEA
ncbi:glycosyltransferase family 4 protein [Vibrio cholerae]|nr:glycosyltransferase [Vibrio cholerae]EGR4421138.1 glycosyltransferase [Vibrio cholerae]EGR4432038.1 glycosyltransferase [Vibrio cholerae]HAS5578482.1 glycosyltransferase family 4 protein [Vibrio cholerae]